MSADEPAALERDPVEASSPVPVQATATMIGKSATAIVGRMCVACSLTRLCSRGALFFTGLRVLPFRTVADPALNQ